MLRHRLRIPLLFDPCLVQADEHGISDHKGGRGSVPTRFGYHFRFEKRISGNILFDKGNPFARQKLFRLIAEQSTWRRVNNDRFFLHAILSTFHLSCSYGKRNGYLSILSNFSRLNPTST